MCMGRINSTEEVKSVANAFRTGMRAVTTLVRVYAYGFHATRIKWKNSQNLSERQREALKRFFDTSQNLYNESKEEFYRTFGNSDVTTARLNQIDFEERQRAGREQSLRSGRLDFLVLLNYKKSEVLRFKCILKWP